MKTLVRTIPNAVGFAIGSLIAHAIGGGKDSFVMFVGLTLGALAAHFQYRHLP